MSFALDLLSKRVSFVVKSTLSEGACECVLSSEAGFAMKKDKKISRKSVLYCTVGERRKDI